MKPISSISALLVGGFLWFGSLPADAQFLLRSGNGSATVLAPLQPTKKMVRRMTKSITVQTNYAPSSRQYFVVAFDALPSEALQRKLADVATFVSYFPENTYLYAAPDAKKAVAQIETLAAGQTAILATGAMPVDYKWDVRLLKVFRENGELDAEARNGGLEVSVYDEADLAPLCASLERWEMPYERLTPTSVKVTRADMDAAKQLAAVPYVNTVAVFVAPTSEDLPGLEYIMRSNMIDIVNYDRKGPIGTGVYFQNWERYGAEDYFPVNTYGRTLPGALGDNSKSDLSGDGHGTFAGSISASANNYGEVQSGGMAPGMTYLSSTGGTAGFANNSGGYPGRLCAARLQLFGGMNKGRRGLQRLCPLD